MSSHKQTKYSEFQTSRLHAISVIAILRVYRWGLRSPQNPEAQTSLHPRCFDACGGGCYITLFATDPSHLTSPSDAARISKSEEQDGHEVKRYLRDPKIALRAKWMLREIKLDIVCE